MRTCRIVSATGNTVPPAMVFPMLNGSPPGSMGLAHPSGWMRCDNFVQVMQHFIHHTKSSKENPFLLIYDNHASHISIQVIDLAKANGIP